MSDSEGTPHENNVKDHAEENDAGSTEAVKPAAKKGVGRAKESKAKEEKKPETDEGSEEGDSGDDEEPKLGLLDQPLELSGSRQRKKVERLEVSFQQPAKEKTEVPQGKGTPLGQCPRIENEINKHKADSLKGLHKILFNRAGAPMEIKKNLKKFSGFTFDKDSADYDKKKKALIKVTVKCRKEICGLLDLEKGGTVEEQAERILLFLLCPEDNKKPLPGSAKKRKAAASGEKRPARSKRTAAAKASKKVSCWNAPNGCDFSGSCMDVLQHFEQDCGLHTTSCPNCDALVPRDDVVEHLRSACTARVIQVVEAATSASMSGSDQRAYLEMKQLLEKIRDDHLHLQSSFNRLSEQTNIVSAQQHESYEAGVTRVVDLIHEVETGLKSDLKTHVSREVSELNRSLSPVTKKVSFLSVLIQAMFGFLRAGGT